MDAKDDLSKAITIGLFEKFNKELLKKKHLIGLASVASIGPLMMAKDAAEGAAVDKAIEFVTSKFKKDEK